MSSRALIFRGQTASRKYQKTIEAYLRNTGEVLGRILEETNNATSSDRGSSSTTQGVGGTQYRKRQSETLYNYNNDLLWAGEVRLGTPPQDFTILFDTGKFGFLGTSLPLARHLG